MLKNILLGKQDPGKKQTLKYIECKEPPHYPLPATYETTDIATAYASLNTDVFEYYVTLKDYGML